MSAFDHIQYTRRPSTEGVYDTYFATYKGSRTPIARISTITPRTRTFDIVSVPRVGSAFVENERDSAYHAAVPPDTTSHLSRQFSSLFEIARVPFHESGLVTDDSLSDGNDDDVSFAGVRPAKENEQLQLFHAHQPARWVSGMYSRNNPTAKISAMTMLGIADLHARQETGKALTPDTSLSPHSMNIVEKLNKAGAIKDAHVPHSISNDMDFVDAEEELDHSLVDFPRSPREDVTAMSRAARTHIRSVMGKPSKPKEVNNNPEGNYQPTLWED